MAEQDTKKVSKVELIKEAGNYLRGTIAEALHDGTPKFGEDDIQLLKFHGMYQQDDRDLRKIARKEGRDKHYMMMIRARIPGGVLSPEGYLQFDGLADKYGNGTLRITTRQTFQLHGILKSNLKETVKGINDVLVTLLGGCGDQVRNIIACPSPSEDVFHQELREDILALVNQFGAKTNAYHEIWLDGEKVDFEDKKPEEIEPIYGRVYMPRKFKIAAVAEGDNCIDVYANDLGLVAHHDGDRIAGYTVLVGGGMGRTASNEETYPRLASPVAYCTREQLIDMATAIVTIQRDFGNREDRRYARFKYLLDERGLDWFKEELSARLGRELTPPRELIWESAEDHLGWHHHGEGRSYIGIFVQNGRVKDTEEIKLKTVLREIVEEFRPTIRMTPQQNILLSDLSDDARPLIEQKLRAAGVRLADELSHTLLHSMACPAMPTCGLATAESERALPDVLPEFEKLFAEFGLADERISIRMTGCPNGCARPYIGDIGFVGRTPGKYDLFLAGNFVGTRMNSLYKELVPIGKFIDTLRPIVIAFTKERNPGEQFGDYCNRVGFDRLRELESVHA